MVVTHSVSTLSAPHHRQNRRRERPSSRVRRSSARKSHAQSNIQDEFYEGVLDAYDTSVPLPSDRSKPSPLLRQNFDQSWQRWKARQAEEQAIAEMDRMQLEQDQIKMFGGDVDDGELIRLGILYDDRNIADVESTSTVPATSHQQYTPTFIIRPSKASRRARNRGSTWRTLPLYLSFSDLSKDIDIARLLSPSTSHPPTVQHRDNFPSPTRTITPQSLPHISGPEFSHDFTSIEDLNSASSFELNPGEWTFIGTANHTPHGSTPSSEPETWILLSDDS